MKHKDTLGLERLYEDQVVLNISEIALLEVAEAKGKLIEILIDSVATTPCVVSPPENEGYYKHSLIEDGNFPLAFKVGYDGCPYPSLRYDESIGYGLLRADYALSIINHLENEISGVDSEGYLSGYTCLMNVIFELANKRAQEDGDTDLFGKESLVIGFLKVFDGHYSEAFWQGLVDALGAFLPDGGGGYQVATHMFKAFEESTNQQQPPDPQQT